MTANLFFKGPQIGDGSLDIVVRKVGWSHQCLIILFHSLFDGLEGIGIREAGLNLGIGVIAGAELLPHPGRPFPVVAVTFGTMIAINRVTVGEGIRALAQHKCRRYRKESKFFHRLCCYSRAAGQILPNRYWQKLGVICN